MSDTLDRLMDYFKQIYDFNNNGRLDMGSSNGSDSEFSIFNKTLSSLNTNNKTVQIFKHGKWVKVSVVEFLSEMDEYSNANRETPRAAKTVPVQKEVFGRIIEFNYNKTAIEDHVINNFTGHGGEKITYFSEIPAIRRKHPFDRTAREKRLLKEFNNMINWAIKSGSEYGVDPKKIIAIMEVETGGKGTNYDADGKSREKIAYHCSNGNGYMAITSVCIVDILGGSGNSIASAEWKDNPRDKNGKYIKSTEDYIKGKYGHEMVKLLKSRGFNLKKCNTAQEKKALAEEISQIIRDNTDPEFNIRMGTLVLRLLEKMSGWNFATTARNYNGSDNKVLYSRLVMNRYNALIRKEGQYA